MEQGAEGVVSEALRSNFYVSNTNVMSHGPHKTVHIVVPEPRELRI